MKLNPLNLVGLTNFFNKVQRKRWAMKNGRLRSNQSTIIGGSGTRGFQLINPKNHECDGNFLVRQLA